MADWSEFIAAGILVLIRVSGLMLFVPFFLLLRFLAPSRPFLHSLWLLC